MEDRLRADEGSTSVVEQMAIDTDRCRRWKIDGDRVKKEEPVNWIDDAGLSLELTDEQHKSVAGSTGKE